MIVTGAAMGWTPAQVREATLHDFEAAFEGWCSAQGVEVESYSTEEDVEELKQLMERYPDG